MAKQQSLFIDRELVESELNAVRVVSGSDALSLKSDYLKHSDRGFELILYALFDSAKGKHKFGLTYDDVQLLIEGADRGRDIVLRHEQLPVALVQCKRRKARINLTSALRELARFLLAARQDPRLMPHPDRFTYILAPSSGVTGGTAGLFHEPRRVLADRESDLRAVVSAVVKDYKSFSAMEATSAAEHVLQMLQKVSLKLLTPDDLDLWLRGTPKVFAQFFTSRLVVDAETVRNDFQQVDRKLDLLVSADTAGRDQLLSRWLRPTLAATFSVVAPSPAAARGAAPFVLQDLYVPRTIESQIDKWLAKPDPAILAVIAPGGFGKTSLLWNYHRKLSASPDWEVLLCTSSEVTALVDRGGFHDSLQALLVYARGMSESGKRLVMCLDTFDVLFHRADLLDAALALVEGISDAGASIILSSRPEEIGQVDFSHFRSKPVRLYLEVYDDTEFALAVATHYRVFSGGLSLTAPEVAAQVERLQNLVALGRPVKEVCVNPLTLRMLFELYAGEVIPEDINSFRLYTEYWIARVLGDRRAGTQSLPAGDDLSAAVQTLAARMLAVGAPSLSRSSLTQAIAASQITTDEVTQLCSRNLLIPSDLGAVEFFHQTFFEYSAARYLHVHEATDVKKCISELRKAANDGFRLPVYEQLLLLKAESPGQAALEEGIHELLHDSHPGLLGAGLHVHMLSHDGLRCGRQFVRNAAKNKDAAVLKRYCQLIYNLRRNRAQEVVQLIEASWDGANWQILELLSQMVLWLAQNDWRLCRRQLESRDFLPTLYKATRETTAHVERLIVSIYRHGLTEESDWVFRELLRCTRNHRHHPTVLAFMAEMISRMSAPTAQEVAERITARVQASPSSHTGTDMDPPANCLAALWDRFPDLCPISPDSGLAESTSAPLLLRSLARSSNPALDFVKNELLARIPTYATPGELHLMVRDLLLPLLRMTALSASLRELAMHCCTQVLQTALGPAADQLKSVASGFIKDLYANGIATVELATALAKLPASRWLEDDQIVRLFPIGVAEELPQALSALEAVYSQVQQKTSHVAALAGTLSTLPSTAHRLSTMVRLASATQEVSLALNYLSRLESAGSLAGLHGAIVTEASALKQLARNSLESRDGSVRSRAYALLALLVRQRVIAAPPYETVLAWATTDPELTSRLAAFPLLVETTQPANVQQSVRALLEMVDKVSSGSLNRVVDALRSVLVLARNGLPIEMVEVLCTFALRDGATEPQASIIGRVIDSCCAADMVEHANHAALQLLRSPVVRRLSATQKRTLAHHLDKPFQALYSLLYTKKIRLHLAELRGIDPYLGRLIVVALCKCERAEVRTLLTSPLEDSEVRPELRKIVQDYRQFLWKR